MVQQALSELDSLASGLLPILNRYRDSAIEWHQVRAELEKFAFLRSDLSAASEVLGMASPMLGEIQDNPQPVELGVMSLLSGLSDRLTAGDRPRFGRVRSAVNWLLGRGIATEEEIQKTPERSARRTASMPGPFSSGEDIRRVIDESVRRGEDRKTFQRRIRQELRLAKGQEGTLLRTQAKRSYLSGQASTMRQPVNVSRWPYVMYVATPDERVREHHWALDSRNSGLVAHVGSTDHERMVAVASEWNCRCSMIPVTRGQAKKLGLSTAQGVIQ